MAQAITTKAAAAADKAASAVETSGEDFARQIETLRADVAALGQTLADATRSQAGEAAQNLREAGRKAAGKVEEGYDALQTRASEAVDHIDGAVRERPALALGVAAGLGMLAGLLLARRA